MGHKIESGTYESIGARVREQRIIKGLSQKKLADKVGASHQQVQKYEKGMDRISVDRLVKIAKVLEKPSTYFYDEDWQPEIDPARAKICMEIVHNISKLPHKMQNAYNNLIRMAAEGCNAG